MAKGALIAVANMTMRDKDPTMTLTLRAKFVAQMNKRFRALKGAINKSIIDNDCFAIKKTVANVALTPLGAKTFQYTKDPEKVKGFMDWLKGEEEKGILEISMVPSMMGPTGVPWTNVYIQSAYQKGMAQARIDMKQGGAPIDTYTDQTLNMAFYQPFHADRVALIYTRAYNELKGVTEAMNQQISRELALGMARGDGPYRIAQLLNDRVDKIGIVRARLIARTETVHALNEAALNEYELLENMVGETVRVKWWTALDERVRSQHAAWHGKVMTRKVGRARIGAPNCRCALRPWLDSWDDEEQEPSAEPKKKAPKKSTIDRLKAAHEKARLALSQKPYDPVLGLAERRAYYELQKATLTAEEIVNEKRLLLKRMVKYDKKITPAMAKKLDKAVRYIPLDVLDQLEKKGYTIRISTLGKRSLRASYRDRDRLIKVAKDDTYDVISHELGHAIDGLFNGNGHTGLKWYNELFVTSSEEHGYESWFNKIRSRKIGIYKNGDGKYWKDNWLSDYEGRIYSTGGHGQEWWAMNIQRYSKYVNQFDSFDTNLAKYTKEAGAGQSAYEKAQLVKLEKLKQEGREAWAARTSGWTRVRDRYPELSGYIEKKFGKDFAFVP